MDDPLRGFAETVGIVVGVLGAIVLGVGIYLLTSVVVSLAGILVASLIAVIGSIALVLVAIPIYQEIRTYFRSS